MKNIVSRTLSVHKEHELLLKLETAGLDNNLAQLIIDSRNNKIALKIINLLQSEVITQTSAQAKLLKPVDKIIFEGTKKFEANQYFTKKNSDGVKFSYVDHDFDFHLRNKIEQNVKTTTLKAFMLKKDMSYPETMATLGPEIETTLYCLWNLLKQQPRGEKGTLLTNGERNYFFIRDMRERLLVLSVSWSSGWVMNVYLPEQSGGKTETGKLVFSQ